jgi:hypothetical protein
VLPTVGDVLAVFLDRGDVAHLPGPGQVEKDPHQVRLGRVDVGAPPVLDERVRVVVEQEQVLEVGVRQQLEALVLVPAIPTFSSNR